MTGFREGNLWIQNQSCVVWRICASLVHHFTVINSSRKCDLLYVTLHDYKWIISVVHLQSLVINNKILEKLESAATKL